MGDTCNSVLAQTSRYKQEGGEAGNQREAFLDTGWTIMTGWIEGLELGRKRPRRPVETFKAIDMDAESRKQERTLEKDWTSEQPRTEARYGQLLVKQQ